MISGMYMGELARLVIVKHTKAGRLFNGEGSDLLFKRGQFFTKYVSEIEADKPGTFSNCRDVLDELGLEHATDQDCANVRYICECVSSRAAHLVSAGIASLINKMNEPSVTVSSVTPGVVAWTNTHPLSRSAWTDPCTGSIRNSTI